MDSTTNQGISPTPNAKGRREERNVKRSHTTRRRRRPLPKGDRQGDRAPVPGWGGRRVPRASWDGSAYDLSNKTNKEGRESEPARCPYPPKWETVNGRTGEIKAAYIPCRRKRCPVCGPQEFRRKVAHYIDELVPYLELGLYFVTLTLDAEDATGEASMHEIKEAFSNRFVPRLQRRSESKARPIRVAQRERDGHGRVHLHGLVATDLSPRQIQGAWVESGGGIDSVARRVRPTRDDLARTVIYVLKGNQFVSNGPLMSSSDISYHSKRAREGRRKWAKEHYGHTWDSDEVMIPPERVEREEAQSPAPVAKEKTPRRVPRHEAVSHTSDPRYVIRSKYDKEQRTVSALACRVTKGAGKHGYRVLADCPTKVHARKYLRRYARRISQTARRR